MSIFYRIILFCIFIISGLHAEKRAQIAPNGFQELDLRYRNLQKFQPSYLLERPHFTSPVSTNSFLFQIQPTTFLESDVNTPSLTTWIQLELNNGYVLVNEMQIRQNSDLDSSYIGKEWRGGSGATVQSFLQWSNLGKSGSGILIRAGRAYSQLGPGRQGQLLLGAKARPLDQLSFSYMQKLNNHLSARFYYQQAALDKISIHKRFLALHRFEILGKNWYFNFSEAFLYSRNGQGIDAVYLNPFLFYHGEQYNGPDLAGNTIGSVELGYSWNSNHIYSEILIDDIQVENKIIDDLEPNEIGVLVGFEHAGKKQYLSIECVAITNRTYKTPDRAEWFLHRNVPIGYELGSDVARLNLLSRYYFKENWHLDTELDVIWQGEGKINKAWDTPWEDPSVTVESGYSERFPTGLVEQSTELSVEVLHYWTLERWISLCLVNESIQNVNNEKDVDVKGWKFKLGVSWTLDYEFHFQR
jgi:hypothetical protein